VRVSKDVCFEDFQVPGPAPTPVPPHSMTLRAECTAVDAGAVLPNINDGFAGCGPDLGAHERGHEAAVYGPRPVVVPKHTSGSRGDGSDRWRNGYGTGPDHPRCERAGSGWLPQQR
jgi:hypothetical protein